MMGSDSRRMLSNIFCGDFGRPLTSHQVVAHDALLRYQVAAANDEIERASSSPCWRAILRRALTKRHGWTDRPRKVLA